MQLLCNANNCFPILFNIFLSVIFGDIESVFLHGMKICPKTFSAEIEFCRIGPWSCSRLRLAQPRAEPSDLRPGVNFIKLFRLI
jgi:hypothetical protein